MIVTTWLVYTQPVESVAFACLHVWLVGRNTHAYKDMRTYVHTHTHTHTHTLSLSLFLSFSPSRVPSQARHDSRLGLPASGEATCGEGRPPSHPAAHSYRKRTRQKGQTQPQHRCYPQPVRKCASRQQKAPCWGCRCQQWCVHTARGEWPEHQDQQPPPAQLPPTKTGAQADNQREAPKDNSNKEGARGGVERERSHLLEFIVDHPVATNTRALSIMSWQTW